MKVNQSGGRRNLSTYIAGNPGTGKTSLIQRMALWDIQHGRGVCVIDPTADLVNRLIHWIPKHRVRDTIYFDTDHPLPVDFFGYNPDHPGERRMLTDELVAVFNLETAPVSKPRFYAMIGTLLDANQNIPDEGDRYTILDLVPFILSKKFRDQVTDHCPTRKPEWADMPPPKDFYPILDRLRSFTEPGPLHDIFSKSSEKLNIADVIQENKILLINLNDTETDLFIGSLIAAKFQQAAFARRYISVRDRTPYHLYIDECHTIVGYAAKRFEAILTRARKYQLCLLLTNQFPSDLPDAIQKKLRMMGTIILFHLPYDEALIFKHLLPIDMIPDKSFTALVKDQSFVRIIHTPSFLGPSPASYAEIIRKRTIPSPPCDTPQVCLNKGDGNHTPAPKPEEIIATGRTIPPDHGEKKIPRAPR